MATKGNDLVQLYREGQAALSDNLNTVIENIFLELRIFFFSFKEKVYNFLGSRLVNINLKHTITIG